MEIVRTSDPESLDVAARVLNAGGVVVIPTDTVYGLAAHPAFPAAVERLYTIKGREAKKPIALLAADAAAIRAFGYNVPDSLARHWPGALTVVVDSEFGIRNSELRDRSPITNDQSPTTNEPINRSTESEGFRVPDHEWTRGLLRRCDGVLRVTSANLSGQRAATDAPQALADVGLSADLVVDDGVSPGGVPSMVVKVEADGKIAILRQGSVVIWQN